MASTYRTPNYRRRFGWLFAIIVLLFGGYSAGWFYLGGLLETKASEALSAFNRNGREAECANAEARGFPFRMGLWCDSLKFADDRQGVAVTAANFRSAAQVYNPFHIIAELDSPATVDLPAVGAVDADWDNLRASVRADFDFPERVSLELRGLSAKLLDRAASFKLQAGEAHMRRNGPDLDLALSFTGAAPGPEVLRGGTLPPVDGALDLTLNDGVSLALSGIRSPRGMSGTIRTLTISSGPNAALSLSGPVSVDEDGLVDASLMLNVRDPQAISTLLQNLFPTAKDKIATSMMGLSALGDNPQIPLNIVDSQATLGFIPLGFIPRL